MRDLESGGTSSANNVTNPITGDTLLQVQPVTEDIAHYKSKSLQTIDTASYLDPFLRQLPLLATASQLGNAYKIVFPPGVTGKLLKHASNAHIKGLATTTIVGPDGKIVGQAGLQSLAALQAPLVAFVIMSAVTGQYFQAKIERTLRKLSQQIEKIIQLILAEKESDIRSIYHFTQYVSENMSVINTHDDLRLSTLMNVQRNNINLFSLQKFYEKTLSSELDSMVATAKEIKDSFRTGRYIEDLKVEIQNISDYLDKRQMCIDLYMMGRMLELKLASIFHEDYLMNLRAVLIDLKSNNHNIMKRVVDIHMDTFSLQKVKDEPSIPVGELRNKLRILQDRESYTSDNIDNIVAGVDEIRDLDRRGIECFYYNGQLHLLEN